MRNTLDISELEDVMPDAHEELMEILRTLERHYKDMQDTEFTVEEGHLYMLQTRDAKRPAQAAVRFAVDAVDEELLTREEALLTIDAETLDALLHPTFDPERRVRGARDAASRRRRARPWARSCSARPRRWQAAEDGRDVILVRPFTEADDVAGLPRGEGHPHERGRQGQPRGARRARHGRAGGDRAPGSRSTSRPARSA